MSDNLPGNDGSKSEQVLTLVGLWAGALLYGIYAVMFFAAIYVSLRNRKGGAAFSVVLFYSMISMFIMITIWTGINLNRGIQAYALLAVPPTAVSYYHDVARWDNFSYGVIVILLTWHADALVIYRCFVIWGHNFYVIILPCLILAFGFVNSTIFLVWSKHPTLVSFKTAMLTLDMTYPINVTQSTLTTGLIAHRIYMQHRKSIAAGVYRPGTGGTNLLTIVRIVIESALIFTIQQVILLILLRVNSPAQVVFHATTIPSIGIVFVLMALRTHFARTQTEMHSRPGHYSSHAKPMSQGGHSSIAVVTTRTVREDIPMSGLDTRTGRSKGDMTDGTESFDADAKYHVV